jgi:hypothetical protein
MRLRIVIRTPTPKIENSYSSEANLACSCDAVNRAIENELGCDPCLPGAFIRLISAAFDVANRDEAPWRLTSELS